MHWSGIHEFLAMGGYGFYVWLSFGLTLGCMAVELWSVGRRRRQLTRGDWQ